MLNQTHASMKMQVGLTDSTSIIKKTTAAPTVTNKIEETNARSTTELSSLYLFSSVHLSLGRDQ